MHFDISTILRAGLALGGLAAAVMAGLLVGESQWMPLAVVSAVVFAMLVSGRAVQGLASVCLALATLDLLIAPFGFKVAPIEQMGAFAAACWCLVFWRKGFNPYPAKDFTALRSYTLFQAAVCVALVYATTHFIYNFLYPYEDLAFGLNAAAKTYAQVFGSFALVVLLSRVRLLTVMDKHRSTRVLWLFFACLLVSTSVGLVQVLVIGSQLPSASTSGDQSEAYRLFTIPVINAYNSFYTLRMVGPAAVLVGCVFLFNRPKDLPVFLPLATTFVGFVACLASGGRASLGFAAVFILTSAIHARRAHLAFFAVAICAVMMAILHVLPSSLIKDSPFYFQRSVALLRSDLQSKAAEDIRGSSDWRWRYFTYAWDYYTSGDARLVLFGRSVGKMDSTDAFTLALDDEFAAMKIAVRRLWTHNSLTDYLLGWGLFGYILIMAMCLTCIGMLFAYLKVFRPRSHGACWLFIAGSYLSLYVVVTHIGGTFIWPLAIAFILVALSQTDGLPNKLLKVHQGNEVGTNGEFRSLRERCIRET
jgi:hypothetical protein